MKLFSKRLKELRKEIDLSAKQLGKILMLVIAQLFVGKMEKYFQALNICITLLFSLMYHQII